jgi:hypothetical protein
MAIRHTSAIKPLFFGHLNIYLNWIFQRFFMTLFCLRKKEEKSEKIADWGIPMNLMSVS